MDWSEILPHLGYSFGGVAATAMGLKFVKEGTLGSKTTFGKAHRTSTGKLKVYKPGFVFIIPVINQMNTAHIRMDSVTLSDLNITLKNGLSYHYSAYVAYHVSKDPDHLERFIYQVEKPQELISQKLSSSIRELLIECNSGKEVDFSEINQKLVDSLKDYLLDNIGIELDSCGMTSFTESVQAQQVGVVEAKIALAESTFGNIKSIPISVMSACFGSTPVTTGDTKTHVVENDFE